MITSFAVFLRDSQDEIAVDALAKKKVVAVLKKGGLVLVAPVGTSEKELLRLFNEIKRR